MGKKAKEHRAKVAQRNKRIAQEKYAMQNALNKMMKQMAEQQEVENLNVTVGGQEVPFSVVEESELSSIVEFKEENRQMFEPQVEDQISELEK
jgi:hypothetical protein